MLTPVLSRRVMSLLVIDTVGRAGPPPFAQTLFDRGKVGECMVQAAWSNVAAAYQILPRQAKWASGDLPLGLDRTQRESETLGTVRIQAYNRTWRGRCGCRGYSGADQANG